MRGRFVFSGISSALEGLNKWKREARELYDHSIANYVVSFSNHVSHRHLSLNAIYQEFPFF